MQSDVFRTEESVLFTIAKHFHGKAIADAEALADMAIIRFPDSAGVHTQHALVPFYRNDMDMMAARMSGVLKNFPTWAPAYRWSGHALRRLRRFSEAAAILDAGLALHPEDAEILIERGWVATNGGQYTDANAIWRLVRTIAPNRTEGYWAGTRVALRLGDIDAAEVLARRGYERFPQDRFVLLQRGLIANQRRDWEEAGRRWAEAKSLHPAMQEILDGIRAYEAGRDGIESPPPATVRNDEIDIFRNAETVSFHIARHFMRKEYDEAEELVKAAIARFPDNANVHTQRALVPLHRNDLKGAVAELTEVVARYPDWGPAHRWLGSALRRSKRFAEAKPILIAGRERFPDNADIVLESGWLANEMGEFVEALPIWKRLRELAPQRSEGWWLAAMAELRLERMEEAEDMCQQAYDRFPENPFVLIYRGLIATRRQDWSEAGRRWAEAKAAFPNMPEVLNGIGEYEANRTLEGVDDDLSLLKKPVEPANSELASLLNRFESLGSNCEVGLVQRMAGLEPLGLLRWASIRPDRLIAMLDSDLEGVGDMENTTVRTTPNGEWVMRDERYFGMHTFMHGNQMGEDQVRKSCARRSRFLADKLRQDLINPEKCFVYKHHDGPLGPERIEAILKAIRRYGPGKLLCVQKAPVEGDKRVKILEDGLLIANLPEVTPDAPSVLKRLDIWHQIFREAQALLDGERPA